jgi:hypothetical protein
MMVIRHALQLYDSGERRLAWQSLTVWRSVCVNCRGEFVGFGCGEALEVVPGGWGSNQPGISADRASDVAREDVATIDCAEVVPGGSDLVWQPMWVPPGFSWLVGMSGGLTSDSAVLARVGRRDRFVSRDMWIAVDTSFSWLDSPELALALTPLGGVRPGGRRRWPLATGGRR